MKKFLVSIMLFAQTLFAGELVIDDINIYDSGDDPAFAVLEVRACDEVMLFPFRKKAIRTQKDADRFILDTVLPEVVRICEKKEKSASN